MENNNIRKIHTLGKVSRILITILQVAIIIGFVASILITVAAIAMPDDSVSIKGSANAEIILSENFPDKVFDLDIEESNFQSKIYGVSLKWIVTQQKANDGSTVFNIDGAVNDLSGHEIKFAAVFFGISLAVLCVLFYIILGFGKKLAKALETCNSPFEPEVLKRMKSFGISLIPWAVFRFAITGSMSGLTTALLVMVVLLFVYIFSYGAQLQQESDETL